MPPAFQIKKKKKQNKKGFEPLLSTASISKTKK
jgi:hypothetical protein